MQNGVTIKWFSKPANLLACFSMVIPIVIAQILQRLYPIIDNRYLTALGTQALYIHNIVYNFMTFGQFVGLATYISCLVFWRREECVGKQGSILISHLLLATIVSFIVGLIGFFFSHAILVAYKVEAAYLSTAMVYLRIGLLNVILIAIYCGLDGMLVASKKQNISMFIAFGLVIVNIVADRFAVYHAFYGVATPDTIYYPMLIISLSTSFCLLVAILVSLVTIIKNINGWDSFPLKTLLGVWWSEFGVYLIRGITPFVFTYQLCHLSGTSNFLVTYQLTLQLSYILCLPLIGAIQIAIRDAAASFLKTKETSFMWWPSFFYTGFLPSTFLLVIGIIAPLFLLKIVFGYSPPVDHIGYLSVFFVSCWVGQCGNTFTIPIRALKKNYLVAKNFFSSELLILIGGTQLFILMGDATPTAIGYLTLLFSFVYAYLNFYDAKRLVGGLQKNEVFV